MEELEHRVVQEVLAQIPKQAMEVDSEGVVHDKVQGAHFEQATSAQATQLQTFQESFHEQFKQQVSHQQTMLDGMFERQMSQFESLLAKRHRPE